MNRFYLTTFAVYASLAAIAIPLFPRASVAQDLKSDSIAIAKSIPADLTTKFQLAGGPAEPHPDAIILDEMGVIEDGDEIIELDGSLFDPYVFEGLAGQTVRITAMSSDFDTFLIVYDENGTEMGHSDDVETGNTDSELLLTLPSDGSYIVVVNGLDSTSRGNYRVSVIIE
jgi:hypothetical protein